ncbi:hypothetical protein JOB18_016731 [Solea senegalensis]|uniref:Uncharacterized protein n=1 Tax=Solea senegalensis TaxID=28829 RepID=A0AAV6RID8_SOLSE|nr:hypothetical protein JOB18_016731 [Solea senegalensis]
MLRGVRCLYETLQPLVLNHICNCVTCRTSITRSTTLNSLRRSQGKLQRSRLETSSFPATGRRKVLEIMFFAVFVTGQNKVRLPVDGGPITLNSSNRSLVNPPPNKEFHRNEISARESCGVIGVEFAWTKTRRKNPVQCSFSRLRRIIVEAQLHTPVSDDGKMTEDTKYGLRSFNVHDSNIKNPQNSVGMNDDAKDRRSHLFRTLYRNFTVRHKSHLSSSLLCKDNINTALNAMRLWSTLDACT